MFRINTDFFVIRNEGNAQVNQYIEIQFTQLI
jgi:hypothetical protein